MRVRRSTLIGSVCVAASVVLSASALQAQSPPGAMRTGAAPAAAAAGPPVLSTVPVMPSGAPSQPGTMSGLPLQVGDLPPGTVAVRVVRQPFTNVAGQQVDLKVGAEGRLLKAATGADGRAQFSGLAVGEHVIAVATVDGERLESQLFPLPAKGGVRVLLVAGQPGAAIASASAAAPSSAPAEAGLPVSVPVAGGGPSKTAVVLVLLFGLAGVGVWRSAVGPPRLRRPAASNAETGEPAHRSARLRRRDRLYDELVQLERERGLVDENHSRRREALVVELEALYAELDGGRSALTVANVSASEDAVSER